MRASRHHIALVVTLATMSLTNGGLGVTAAQPAGVDHDPELAVHVLNRITFGPRPGDVDRVSDIGLAAFIAEQLEPRRIDDRAVERQLGVLETLELPTETHIERYLDAVMAIRDRRQSEASDTDSARGSAGRNESMRPRPESDAPPEVREMRHSLVELVTQKLMRAVSSERQLQEVLVDFWFNHFNVSAQKGLQIHPYLVEYERDALRPHVLGSFRELLGAVAASPAMLIYLDNWLSSDPDADHPWTQEARARRDEMGQGRRGREWRRLERSQRRSWPRMVATVQSGPRDGLNENYARELLELHTLGVDGDYTQEDIVEVARAFTGWTIAPFRRGGGFAYASFLHTDGDKEVLGTTIDGGGQRDGEQVLDLLAIHPATARFVSTKLVSRFVADDPPEALVDRTAARFLDTGGDLLEVMRTILTSTEFLAPEAQRAKVKTPLEFVVSSIRALDGHVTEARGLFMALTELGMPPYQCQPPTGYSDRADAWVNTGSLLARMNFSIMLVNDRLPGVDVGLPSADSAEGEAIRRVLDRLVRDNASDATRSALDEATTAAQLAVLAIGSPEFQRQ